MAVVKEKIQKVNETVSPKDRRLRSVMGKPGVCRDCLLLVCGELSSLDTKLN